MGETIRQYGQRRSREHKALLRSIHSTDSSDVKRRAENARRRRYEDEDNDLFLFFEL